MSALKEFARRRKMAVKSLEALLGTSPEISKTTSVRKALEIFSDGYESVVSDESYGHLQEMMKTVGTWTKTTGPAIRKASSEALTAAWNAHAVAKFISKTPRELLNAGYDPILPSDFKFAIGTKNV